MSTIQRAVVESRVRTLDQTANYLTSEERDMAKQLFYACGILPLNATGEADNTLAYFAKRGMVDAVISNDLDLLARGVDVLLVPEPYALPGDTSGWRMYTLQTILRAVEFTYEQFVEMCILMGCDYTHGCKSLPYKSAYWAIKYRGELHKTLDFLRVPDRAPYERAHTILVGSTETPEELMGPKQWENLAAGAPAVEHDALQAFRKIQLATLPDAAFDLLLHT